MSERSFAVAATVIGILFIIITPPFQVPDEWNHYVRSEAIAQGHVVPDMTFQGDCTSFPDGVERFVRAVYRTEGTFTLGELRSAATIRRDYGSRSILCFPAWYTPVPYVPQVIIAALSSVTGVRPIVTFYTGRLMNLAFAILLLFAAMRAAPELRNAIAAVTLLPMAMFQLASWSADAPTFAAAVLLTALLVRAARSEKVIAGPEALLIAAVALVVALCKPVYFLVVLLMFAVPRRRFRSRGHWLRVLGGVLLAVAIGVTVSAAAARHARFNARYGLDVDASRQAQCIVDDPGRFIGVVFDDVGVNGTAYVEEMIGRLGMMDVKLPPAIIWFELVLLVFIGVIGVRSFPALQRFLAIVIALLTIGGVLLSQYLIWSVVCGRAIEGVQGRYFLPILPLLLAAAGTGLRAPERVQRIAILWVAALANTVALFVLLTRYWI